MKHLKKLLALLLALTLACGLLPAALAAGPAEPAEPDADYLIINSTNFPDANFRAFVLQYDTNSNYNLSPSELAAVTSMDCSNKNIANLKGIEHFTALTKLNCGTNQLTSLDLSKNTALTVLYCYENQLTSLDVRNNTALVELGYGNNQLTSLDLSKNTALTRLESHDNQLTSLDLSKNTALKYLYCVGNQLTSLDLSKNTALWYLFCNNNQLTSLNLSKNAALETLSCSNNKLTSLDVSKNTALTSLYCTSNPLKSLDVSKNVALEILHCDNDRLTSLDVTKNTALTELLCRDNYLTALDVSKNTALTLLSCVGNQLTSLDVSKVPALKDAVENGAKESYYGIDRYYSSQGELYVDTTVTIVTDSPDLGSYTFDFRSGPVEHPGFAIGLELAVMANQGDIGISSGGNNVSLLDLDLDGHSDVRIYSKNGTYYFYVDSHTNLRGTYTLTVSEAVKNAFVSSGSDYYSSFTFQYPSPWNPFTDVKEGKDYYDAILWAYYHDPQVTTGVTATTFGVGKAVKRGDAMVYLWVAAGKPEPTLTKSPFTDVTDPKAYYYKAILWAYENGITKGVSATEFGRKKTVSRRDMLAFLYKQQGSPAPTLTKSPYSDVTDPKAYYYKAVMWAYEKGIERGSGGKFNGKTNCLRETVVLWMYRVLAE